MGAAFAILEPCFRWEGTSNRLKSVRGYKDFRKRFHKLFKIFQVSLQNYDEEIRDIVIRQIRCSSCSQLQSPEMKLLKCARCKLAFYCGPTCQKNHWEAGHKEQCHSKKKPSRRKRD